MDAAQRWSRRHFLGRTADVALLSALAGALEPLATLAAQGTPGATLYDRRFPAARVLALELARAGPVQATDGDATAFVSEWADLVTGDSLPRLQGVTTESVPFCLQQLVPQGRLTQRRVDRDLFVWTFEART
jgi:hypothetical protein